MRKPYSEKPTKRAAVHSSTERKSTWPEQADHCLRRSPHYNCLSDDSTLIQNIDDVTVSAGHRQTTIASAACFWIKHPILPHNMPDPGTRNVLVCLMSPRLVTIIKLIEQFHSAEFFQSAPSFCITCLYSSVPGS